jgi:hypothetical protein
MNKPIQTQKVPFGVDPKTVLCVFFKAGHCEKGELEMLATMSPYINELFISGNKCKFSHDKNIERKAQKASVYEDVRAKKDDKAAGEPLFSTVREISIISNILDRRHHGTVG